MALLKSYVVIWKSGRNMTDLEARLTNRAFWTVRP